MSNQDTLSRKKEILQDLSKRQLKPAIELLMKLATDAQNWIVVDKLKELDTNYRFMLHYQFEGGDDPERTSVYNNFLRTLYEATDDVSDSLLLSESSAFFYEKNRIVSFRSQPKLDDYQNQLKSTSDSLALLELMEDGEPKWDRLRDLSVKRERAATDLFMAVFVSQRAEDADYNTYLSMLNSAEIKEREKCLIITALTLSLFHRFDSRKARILLTFCESENVQLKQRAIVGLIIILQMYDARWRLYSECVEHLESLAEDIQFKKSVLNIIKQLIRSRETEKISKRLTEEIIPEMMKFNSLAGRKLDMDDLMGDSDLSEKNPDWKKELEKSGLADKLQEYSNLQMEGADVFHSTFSSLKSFPFFSDLSNWFMPFDPNYSELQTLFKGTGSDNLLYTAVLSSGHMCNSDKYSFSLSLLQLPQSQRDMMLHRFGSESAELKQLQKDAAELNPTITEEVISNQYIQDLYRFFKLHPSRNSIFDVFKMRINFYEKKSILPFISGREDMLQIAQYCFDKNFLSEALHIYLLLSTPEFETSDIWQKVGYCRQMLNDADGALDAYLKADLLLPDNSWTMKRIAQLYKALKKPELALEYYLKIQRLTPDNLYIELNIGHCYLDMKDYAKALNVYFKVELLDGGDNPKSWRPIAWTAFLEKRFDMSRTYYEKILSAKPTIHDYLNAGHVELIDNKRKAALKFYQRAVSMLNNDVDEFVSLFLSDKDDLILTGADESFFVLLFDELRYTMN